MIRSFTNQFGLLALVGLGLTAAPAAAQDRAANRQRNPEERIERRVERLDQQLELTEAQEQQIRGMLQENAREMQQAREQQRTQGEQDREARRAAFRTRVQEADREVAAVLTAEQRQKYETLKAERKTKMEQRRNQGERGDRRSREGRTGERRGRRGNPVERLTQELALTDAQQQELRQLFQAERAAMQAWNQAHPNATREEKRAYFQSRSTEVNAAIEARLTPEQVEQYRARRDELMQRRQHRGHRKGEGRTGGAQPAPQNGN